MEENEVRYTSYKHYEKAIAENMVEECPHCGWNEKYSAVVTGTWIIKRYSTGIGEVVKL